MRALLRVPALGPAFVGLSAGNVVRLAIVGAAPSRSALGIEITVAFWYAPPE